MTDHNLTSPLVSPHALEGLFRGVRDIALIWLDPQGLIQAWNTGAEQLLGYAAAEILGHPFAELSIPIEVAAGLPERDLEVTRNEGHWSGERLRRRRDGSLVWARISLSAVRDDQQQLQGYSCTLRDISAEKRLTEELRNSEHRLRMISSTARIGYYDRNLLTGIGFWSPEMHEFHGSDGSRTPTWESIVEMIHPEDRDRVLESYRRNHSADSSGSHRVEYRIVLPDGSIRWLDVLGQVEFQNGPSGRIPIRGFGAVQDITDRKATESTLEQTKREVEHNLSQLRAVFDSLHEGVVLADADANLVYWNPAALAIHGYDSLEEVLLHLTTFRRNFQLSDNGGGPLQLSEWPMSRVMRGEVVRNVELKVVRTDIHLERVISYSGSQVLDSNGQVQLNVLTLQDVTQRRENEQTVRDSEARFRELAEAMPQLVWVATPQGALLYSNQPGVSPKHGILDEIVETVHPDDLAQTLVRWQQILQARETQEMEHRLLTREGEYRWHLSRAVPVFGEHDQVVRWIGTSTDIHDLKRIEAEWRESEVFNRAILDSMTACIAVLDDDGNLIAVNEAWQQFVAENPMAGSPAPQTGIGNNYLAVCDTAAVAGDIQAGRTAQGIRDIIHGSIETFSLEYSCHTADAQRWYLLKATPLKHQLAGAVVAHINITQRVQAELALREERDRFLMTATASPGALYSFRLTPDGKFHMPYASPSIELIYGASPEQLKENVGPIFALKHPEDRVRVTQSIYRSARQLTPWREEFRVLHPRRGEVWIEGRAVPTSEPDGSVLWHGVITDITERKLANSQFEQQRIRLEGIVNSAMDGIITIDEDQKIVVFNAAAEKMFGYSHDTAIGRSLEFLLPERFRLGHSNHVRTFAQTGVTSRAMGAFGAISGLRSDGAEFPMEASISQVELEGKRLFTVTCRDVTERVQADDVRKYLEAQLRQSQKMEAVGQLAGGVAHDFNNLLTVISGYSELLLGKLPVTDRNRQYIQSIQTAGQRAATLTRQLLTFSRRVVQDPKIVNLNFEVRELESMVRRLIGEHILLRVQLEPDLRPVLVDAGHFSQVLVNLVVNARDAMPEGGTITIQTANIDIDATVVLREPDLSIGPYVRLTVTDTGSGMTNDVQARIFEPFFTTKEVGAGTGLGLAVVHGIVKQSNGHISVKSTCGEGSCFEISLPAAAVVEDMQQPLPVIQQYRGQETILLVEDEPAVLELISTILTAQGYRVISAASGPEALQLAERFPNQIDLLLTDVVMPQMDGSKLAELLQPRLPQMRVLFMSGYTHDAIIRRGLSQDPNHFLQKPPTPTELAAKVRQVLDARR